MRWKCRGNGSGGRRTGGGRTSIGVVGVGVGGFGVGLGRPWRWLERERDEFWTLVDREREREVFWLLIKASRFPLGPSLRLLVPPPIPRRHRHLDRRVGVDMCVPVLLVRNGNSGASLGIDQGSDSRYQVVYGADPLLDPISITIFLLIKF
ncbi:hypothetical protein RHSIM_Rhsim13G0186700 [Rhododendron simsii]|uniref:Uncharacterized protein n=1 Tax=Rhododendron simsii TaxID=118357 RepID=A0A834L5N6_RHOSS|nr:hypothetical protein RHSIM_Rhsim13G0186700 [Rhododendron simsii]